MGGITGTRVAETLLDSVDEAVLVDESLDGLPTRLADLPAPKKAPGVACFRA